MRGDCEKMIQERTRADLNKSSVLLGLGTYLVLGTTAVLSIQGDSPTDDASYVVIAPTLPQASIPSPQIFFLQGDRRLWLIQGGGGSYHHAHSAQQMHTMTTAASPLAPHHPSHHSKLAHQTPHYCPLP